MDRRRIYAAIFFVTLATVTLKMLFFILNKGRFIFKPTEQGNQKNLNEKANRWDRRKPLLTLFTTFKEIGVIPHHQFAYNTVLSNWPSFLPFVRPILFLNFTNSKMAQYAKTSGWEVLPLTKTNDAGTPFLAEMYQTVYTFSDAAFYGHANGDILFDDSLVSTLNGVEQTMPTLENRVLVTGRRTNVNIDLKRDLSQMRFHKDALRVTANEQGMLKPPSATDYFFFSKAAFLNWTKLASLVIGRPGYDNYMIAAALRERINVIDSTETLLAVHISEKGVSSHGIRNKDSLYNVNLLGSTFKRSEGFTTNAKLETYKDGAGNVFVAKKSSAKH